MTAGSFSKNLIIVVLVASACYLAGQLWFERIASNRSFLYTIAGVVAPFAVRADVGELSFIEPLRIVSMLGNASYHVDYNITDSPAMNLAEAAVSMVMRGGRHTHSDYADWQALLAREGYIMEYALTVPIDMIRGTWGVASGDVLRHVPAFDRIIILPGLAAGEGLNVVFVEGYMAHFFESLGGEAEQEAEILRQGIRREISAMLGQAVPILHSASSETGIFAGNTFIPALVDAFAYTPLQAFSPYVNHSGDFLIGSLFAKVARLFETPAAVSRLITPGEFIFSDENRVVRFSYRNVMEYTNYQTSRYRQSPGMNEAFNTALAFIHADTQILNRVYLSGIIEEEGDFTFLFGYAAEGFPVIVPQAFLESLQLRAPIEVVVRSGIVTNYRKWAMAFKPHEQTPQRLVSTSFWEAYDRVLEDSPSAIPVQQPTLHRAALAFYVLPDEPFGLVWQLHIDAARFIVRD